VQIIDYSISIDYSKLKSKKIKLPTRGTSFYMAPEVIKGDTIDVTDLNKVDLYSFGVILYYFAFGYYPFNLTKEDAKQNDKIYEKITKELIIENEDNYYSTLFIDFVKKLLDKDINKRIDINEALNHYWVKGAQILFDEKEKLFNAGTFLSYLITDHIKNFDDYIKKTN
jgi:serine/threonine protein kinase